ncbi:MAG: hypothetical protein ACLFVQ_12740 [Chitinispirillaceae bacterium]
MRWIWIAVLVAVVGCSDPVSSIDVVNLYGTVSESDYEGPVLNILVDGMNDRSALLSVSMWQQGMWAVIDYQVTSEIDGGSGSYVGIVDPDQEYLKRSYRVQYIP